MDFDVRRYGFPLSDCTERLHRTPALEAMLQRACASLVLIQHLGLLTKSIQYPVWQITRSFGPNQGAWRESSRSQPSRNSSSAQKSQPEISSCPSWEMAYRCRSIAYLYDVHDGQTTNKEGVMIMIRKPNGAATARPIRNESLV